jgi:hypothetical protein
MHTLRFGRKLSLPSTIAIKHQVRMLMAGDQAKKEEAEASEQSTYMPQERRSQAPDNPAAGLRSSVN